MNKLFKQLSKDVESNALRYRWILLLFLLVYFGEVVLAKVSGGLTSPERQFWYFWFFISVFKIIPYQLSVFASIITILLLIVTTTFQLNISGDIAIWAFTFLFTAVVSILVQAKKENA